MAYFQNKKKEGSFSSAPGQALGGDMAGRSVGGFGKASAAPTSPGGFVNLDTYLGLNEAKGQEMAGQLAKPIMGGLGKGQAGMEKAEGAFNQGLENASGQGKGGISNKGMMGSSPYNSVADVNGWKRGADAVNQAADKAQQLAGGFGQRQGLVNDTFGKGASSYTTGMGLYDNALASANGGKLFESTGKLADYLSGKAGAALGGSAQQAALHNDYANAHNEQEKANLKSAEGAAVAKSSRQAKVQAAADRMGVPLDQYLANNPGAQAYIDSGDGTQWQGVGTLSTNGR